MSFFAYVSIWRILITGAAGLIRVHLSTNLCRQGQTVFGLDNLNDYSDVKPKRARLLQLEQFSNFQFKQIDLVDYKAMGI